MNIQEQKKEKIMQANIEEKNLKCIRSAKLAKILINKGYVVKDIKPRKDNPEATVFLFERTTTLMKIVREYLDTNGNSPSEI